MTDDGSRRWFRPDGTLADGEWRTVVDTRIEGWAYTGLRVGDLGEDTAGPPALHLESADVERLVVPLHGTFRIEVDGADGPADVRLDGRPSFFDGPTDTCYLPPRSSARITGTGRVAVAEASATTRRAVRHLPAAAAPVELRGRGQSSRQVHDLGTPAVLEADRLIVCEVLTPAGNWSSYPPHKHDEHLPGAESRLEEIYYFEVRPVDGGERADAYALFSASSSPATTIELDERVRSGDVVLVPGGFHGPAAAAPGYDLYYLNVMAGPGDRVWEITDHPDHAWVRQTWAEEPADPRLPFGAVRHATDDQDGALG
ncbi:5-deoxy-glucuronate isomerase [Agromyces agglutinans]|uniref:5-deoxy-glucuronate isomerase n=1 Tax=Agromyces agglutinans TaxID=2662258 RepID=UPI0028A85371|nr:5-deoxy-glucuronate isomerase [Agromyces agglutinans]